MYSKKVLTPTLCLRTIKMLLTTNQLGTVIFTFNIHMHKILDQAQLPEVNSLETQPAQSLALILENLHFTSFKWLLCILEFLCPGVVVDALSQQPYQPLNLSVHFCSHQATSDLTK
jgi:hypothetical protein